MGQSNEFPTDCLAPEVWVRDFVAVRIGDVNWRDGSWGNNAAPSWELAQGDLVLAEAFYYTPANAERFTEHFDGQAYVSVVMFDEDENPTIAFESSPEDLMNIVRAAAGRPEAPAASFLKAAEAVPADRIHWDRDI